MLTKNFKAVAAMLLAVGTSNRKGLLPVKNYQGTTYYLMSSTFSQSNYYPYAYSNSVVYSNASTGINLGTGTTAATEDDYVLESIITSGLSCSVNHSQGVDESGNPYLQYDITVNNTGSASVTIGEIGYTQSLFAATAQGDTSGSGQRCLLDRTVLDTPVTIPAGSYAVIRYTLKTILGS